MFFNNMNELYMNFDIQEVFYKLSHSNRLVEGI
jgi:hypothetical protein